MAGYSTYEADFVLKNRDKMTQKQLGEAIGRSEKSIGAFLMKHGLTKPPFRWTQERIDFLKANFKKLSNKELCAHFGCSVSALKTKRFALNLVVDDQKSSRIKRSLDRPANKARYTISKPNLYTTIVRRSA
jgi:Zn-dependent peptidase ImmA (M78 family)